MTATRVADVTDSAAGGELRHRGDIDGLRAVAIILVVAFHAGIPYFGGGFIGVDVFFVISGYLITSKLLGEVRRTGKVRLVDFWANRVRRLVPALTLMVAVVLLASVVVFPRVDWPELATGGAAAAFYVSNILFARDAEDYFATDIEESPFLHTWSLGVEEQFYLLWPLLVGFGVMLLVRFLPAGRRRRADATRTVWAACFAAVFVASFALNIVLAGQGSAWAFFGLPTRAWEFAAAALLAVLPMPAALRAGAARWALAVGGVVLLAVGCVVLDEVSGYPGWWALIPVVATAAILVAGDTAGGAAVDVGPTQVLALPPVQWLGRVSYSWYLWHWPAIILLITALDNDRVLVRALAVAAALPVAALSHRFVENPLRYSDRLRASRRRTLLMGATATAGTVVVALGVGLLVELGGSSLDEKLVAAREERRQYACEEQTTLSGISYCVSGVVDADTTVMLVGDSHARHWKQAMASAAEIVGVRLVDTYRGSCPTVDVNLQQEIETAVGECERFHEEVPELIAEVQPDVVVVSHSTGYASRILGPDGQEISRDEAKQRWADAYRDLLTSLQADGIQPALIRSGPLLVDDPLDCIAEAGAVVPCQPSRRDAIAQIQALRGVEDGVLAEMGPFPSFDALEAVCGRSTCPLMVDDTLVFSDRGHFTVDFTMRHRDALVELLRQALPQ